MARYVILERQFLLANVRVQLLIVLALEREASTKQGIQENSQGPDICWWASVLDLADDLRRHVRRRSTKYFNFLIVWDAS